MTWKRLKNTAFRKLKYSIEDIEVLKAMRMMKNLLTWICCRLTFRVKTSVKKVRVDSRDAVLTKQQCISLCRVVWNKVKISFSIAKPKVDYKCQLSRHLFHINILLPLNRLPTTTHPHELQVLLQRLSDTSDRRRTLLAREELLGHVGVLVSEDGNCHERSEQRNGR